MQPLIGYLERRLGSAAADGGVEGFVSPRGVTPRFGPSMLRILPF
jgi:hypothetical protein